MIPKLTKEQSDALHASGDGVLNVVDPATRRTYVLVDAVTFADLERRQTHAAIQAGLHSMETGGGQPLAEAMADLRAKYESKKDS